MKLKKLIAIFLLTTLLLAQVSWVSLNNIVYAAESEMETNFHYAQLGTEAKKIYQAMYKMYIDGMFKTGTQGYDLVQNGIFTEDEVKEYEKGNNTLTSAMDAARYAFYADYPEIFYVNFQKVSIRITKGASGEYHAYIGSGRFANYYTDGFMSAQQVEQAIVEFDNVVNEIAAKAENVKVEANQNKTVEQVKLVHNEIINRTGYRLESDCKEGNEGFISTPYGALVEKEAVCEGYARAFKTILDKVGVNNILVQGTHQSEGSAAVPHMWNYVEIEKSTVARTGEKVWYAVDCTLDDPFLRNPHIDTTQPEYNPGDDITEGFENTRYCLVGTETMNKEHVVLESVEAAGFYTFKYPELYSEDYGIDNVTNVNGLLVKFKQEGTETEEYRAGDFYISYNNKGYAEAVKEGKYILMKYHEYRPGDDIWIEGKWGYMNPELYAPGAFQDYGDHIYIIVANGEYVEFAVTTLAPSEGLAGYTYQGDESDFVAQSGKLYNPNGIYKSKPYIKKQTPAPTATLSVGPTYHVDVTYDDDLVLAEGATEVGYTLDSTGPTGADEAEITNFVFDGKNRVTFDLKFSKMWADDGATYHIYLTGLVGKNSGKAPMEISYGAINTIACSFSMNKAKNWEVFGRPTLLENEDLSMNGWQTSDGEDVSDKLKSRIALVTTRTTKTERETMNDLMENELGSQELVTSETYNISLNVCKKYVVKTGHRLRISLGFPEGYGPEDVGVTFKAYHFKRDNAGNVTGVEEIPCVVTPYGLIITCDSFSPFAIAVVENDGTVPQNKAIVVSATEGGNIEGANREEGNIVTLTEGASRTLNVRPDAGYEIETITVCGKQVDVSNKETMDVTVNYSDINSENCIVEATFVAKSVVQEEEARGETVAVPVAVPAEITMQDTASVKVGETLTIQPTVTENAEVQTYQWYKNDVRLDGKIDKVLEIENAQEADSGNYVLEVTTTVGTTSEKATSKVCAVTVASEIPPTTPSFATSIEKVSDQPVYSGDEMEVSVKVHDLTAIDKGLITLGGKLDYDKNVLEKISIENQNGWDVTMNEDNLKFVTDNNQYVTGNSDIFKMKFKVKEAIDQDITTIISVKDIVASNGDIEVASENANLEISITKKMEGITSNVYKIEENIISRIAPATTFSKFKTNVETQQDLVLMDKAGNVLGEDAIIATGMTLKVGDKLQFTLVVTGDIDGNGELGITDLAKLKLHYIEQELLTGIALKSADIDGNGEITITDLAQLKLALIGLMEIK